MTYQEVFEDMEFEEKFSEALCDAAAFLPKLFLIRGAGTALFRNYGERVCRFSFPATVSPIKGPVRQGWIFGELEIELGEDGYSVTVPELNFQARA